MEEGRWAGVATWVEVRVRKRRELWIVPGFSCSRLEDCMINPN